MAWPPFVAFQNWRMSHFLLGIINSFLFVYCPFIEEHLIFLWKLRVFMKIAVTAHHSLT